MPLLNPKRQQYGDFFPDLSIRDSVAELMEDTHCNREQLLRTVDMFRTYNRLFARYKKVLGRWLLTDMLSSPQRSYRVADLGSGGCDIPVWLLRKAGLMGLSISVLAVEADERIAAHSRNTYGSVRGLEILCRDAQDLTALGPVDYILGNHFLHHLDYALIEQLLLQAVRMPLRRFIFMDLLRSYPAFYFHSAVAAFLCRGTFIGEDGRRSIRRGFKVAEVKSLLHRVGIQDRVQVHTMLPARIVIVGHGTA